MLQRPPEIRKPVFATADQTSTVPSVPRARGVASRAAFDSAVRSQSGRCGVWSGVESKKWRWERTASQTILSPTRGTPSTPSPSLVLDWTMASCPRSSRYGSVVSMMSPRSPIRFVLAQ
ncbi:MAG: hypothetical protein VX672_08435 [Planctomycetota bacterium]|nr:hypothetical protein [Planctomycetota bacterium]